MRVDAGLSSMRASASCSAIENSMSDSTPMTSACSTRERFSTTGLAVRGEIEAVHRARQVQVAVGIKGAHEAPRVQLQVALHREFGAERAPCAFHVRRRRSAAEAL